MELHMVKDDRLADCRFLMIYGFVVSIIAMALSVELQVKIVECKHWRFVAETQERPIDHTLQHKW